MSEQRVAGNATDSGVFVYETVENWMQLPEGWSALGPYFAGVATDAEQNVYVFNRGEHPMMVFDRDGRFLRSWGEGGQYVSPHGIAMAPDGTLWLADEGAHVVRHCTRDGEVLLELGRFGEPSPYMSGQPFNRCTDVAVAPDGAIYVGDGYGNAAIHKFSPEGEHILSWGGPGTRAGQFNMIHNVACDDDGFVYVADRENSRIQVFDANGRYEGQWNNLNRTNSIFIEHGPNPLCYVGEAGAATKLGRDVPYVGSCITITDKRGNQLARIGGRHAGLGPLEFSSTHDVCVDAAGDIYVAEASWASLARRFPDNQQRESDFRGVHKLRKVKGPKTAG